MFHSQICLELLPSTIDGQFSEADENDVSFME